jgi:hypothetical protein
MPTVADIVERLRSRRAVYDASWRAEVDRLTHEYGREPVCQAMTQLSEQPCERHQWDRQGHARRVQRDIERVMRERKRAFPADPPLPGSWR